AETHTSLDRLMAAMEAYMIDHGSYLPSYTHTKLLPMSTSSAGDVRLLSTPIPYVNRAPTDPLRNGMGFWVYVMGTDGSFAHPRNYPHNRARTWSNGPDRITPTGRYLSIAFIVEQEARARPRLGSLTPVEFGGGGMDYFGMRYEPTNG